MRKQHVLQIRGKHLGGAAKHSCIARTLLRLDWLLCCIDVNCLLLLGRVTPFVNDCMSTLAFSLCGRRSLCCFECVDKGLWRLVVFRASVLSFRFGGGAVWFLRSHFVQRKNGGALTGGEGGGAPRLLFLLTRRRYFTGDLRDVPQRRFASWFCRRDL